MESFPSASDSMNIDESINNESAKNKLVSDGLVNCFDILKKLEYIQDEKSDTPSEYSMLFGQEMAEKLIAIIEDYEFSELDELYIENVETNCTDAELSKQINEFSEQMQCYVTGMNNINKNISFLNIINK